MYVGDISRVFKGMHVMQVSGLVCHCEVLTLNWFGVKGLL